MGSRPITSGTACGERGPPPTPSRKREGNEGYGTATHAPTTAIRGISARKTGTTFFMGQVISCSRDLTNTCGAPEKFQEHEQEFFYGDPKLFYDEPSEELSARLAQAAFGPLAVAKPGQQRPMFALGRRGEIESLLVPRRVQSS